MAFFRTLKCAWCFGLVWLLLTPTAVYADTLPDWQHDTITGDWGGARAALYKQGVDVQLTHKSDVMTNVRGGIKRGTTWMGNSEVLVNIDLEALAGWTSTTVFVQYHSGLGGKFNTEYVGGFVGGDNIEIATNTAQFYQAWVEKSWLNNNVSLLAGLYAIDTEFYVTDSSTVFIQAPYGMANEFAQSGANGPAIFPLGALALRAKLTTPDKKFYVLAAHTDGVPGDPDNPRGTHVQLGGGDGSLSIVELGYTPTVDFDINHADTPAHAEPDADDEPLNYMHKTAIGYWRYSNQFDDLMDVDANGNPRRRHSQGAYIIAERTLFVEPAHPSQGLTCFMRYGVASEDIHQADWSGSLGLHYHGLFASRDDDVAGVAMTLNHASHKYKRLNDAASPEVDYELTYRAQVKPWLVLQPTLQYIVNPGMSKTLHDATVVGFRTELSF